jgi:phosphocarrier protein HPr
MKETGAALERTVRVRNRYGLHARPAAELVKAANYFTSEIWIRKGELEVSGKSIMGVMMLAAEFGTEIVLRARGEDAEAALDALAGLIERRFGEE